MGGRGSSSGLTSTQAAQSQATLFKQLTGQDEQDVISAYNGYNINTKMAINQYIRQDQQQGGYTMSQHLNHKLENDLPLNANEQYVANKLDASMHPIGKNIKLNRGAHQDFLEALGVKNYHTMTESQINAIISGQTYTEKKFVSTAWDASRNPFMSPSSSVSNGREVYLNINAPASTKAVIGNPSQTELILSRSTKYRVKGAHFDGTMAYPRNSGAMPRIVIDIDVID